MNGKWWLVVGAPALSACPPGPCPQDTFVAWDAGTRDAGAAPTQEECWEICAAGGDSNATCSLESPGLVRCDVRCIGGRAPPGLMSLSGIGATVGSWLARMAELEAAAVQAFLHLANEFDAHGLRAFADASVDAARDEVRHADAIARLALRYGVSPRIPTIVPTPIRSLEEIVIDNAREGCGRELFGAEVNAHQAEHATDLEVRRVMASIVDDERRHGAVSLSIAETLMPRMTLATRRRARVARDEALLDLAASFTESAELGLPSSKVAKRLSRRLCL